MKRFSYYMLAILVCLTLFNYAFAEKITIMHVNDTHSNLTPGAPRNADLSGTTGGIARLASVVGLQKATDPNTLFFHAGDFSIGDLLYCKNFAVPELMILNQLKCDAAELGNHEFDLTPAVLEQVLAAGNTGNGINILCANADFSNDTVAGLKQMVQQYKIFTVGTKKVGVIGLITPTTTMLSNPGQVKIMDDTTSIAMGGILTQALKSQGCDVVILLSHLGFIYDQMVAKLVPGIDFIIGGHDHYLFDQPMEVENKYGGKCYILQAGAFLKNVGKLVIDVTDKVQIDSYGIIPLDENIPEEPNTKAAVQQMVVDLETTYKQPFFTVKMADCPADLEEFAADAIMEGNHDTPVGNLAADAFKTWGNTDIAITACGFTSQKLYHGPVVGEDIYRMLGYGFNTVNGLGFRMVKFKIKGSDLMYGIGFGLSQIFFSEDFLIQASGLEYVYHMNFDENDITKNYGELDQVFINKKSINPDEYYSVTTHEGVLAFLNLLQLPVKDLELDNDITEFMALTYYCMQMQNVTSTVEGRVRAIQVSVPEDGNNQVKMASVYPTPCANEAKIEFEVNTPGNYGIKLYDSQGREVLSLLTDYLVAGNQSVSLNTNDLVPGIYTYMISNNSAALSGRVIVIK